MVVHGEAEQPAKRARTADNTEPEEASAQVWTPVTLPKQSLWTGIPSFVRTLGPTGQVLAFKSTACGLGDPETLADIAARFVPREDDVHVITYPKAGTSWIQEVAWLVNHGADIKASMTQPSGKRTVYIELALPGLDKLVALGAAPPPRHIKWHHCAWLVPVLKGRIIYLYRNPKDTVVSWYHFQRMNPLYGFRGSFDDFLELFLEDNVAYGSYWANLNSWWVRRHEENLLILSYEEMHADLSSVVRRVAKHLGKALSDADVEAIVQHCSLASMRANPMTNAASMPAIPGEGQFLRRGEVGNWREYFSDEQGKRMDAWIESRNTSGVPLVYTL